MALNTNVQLLLAERPDSVLLSGVYLFVFLVENCTSHMCVCVCALLHSVCCCVLSHIPSGSKPCPSCAKINPPWDVEDLAQSADCYTFDFSPMWVTLCMQSNTLEACTETGMKGYFSIT